ncbi:hypothetical protein B1A_14806, partial [mine drainage metagenome]
HCQTPSPLTSAGAAARLSLYCKDIDRWPRSWAVFPDLDVPVGERIAAEMKPFLLTLIAERRTKKTVKKYADYLWVLGGELIRRVLTDEKARKLPARTLILKHIDETGGPLWRHARDEQEHAV